MPAVPTPFLLRYSENESRNAVTAAGAYGQDAAHEPGNLETVGRIVRTKVVCALLIGNVRRIVLIIGVLRILLSCPAGCLLPIVLIAAVLPLLFIGRPGVVCAFRQLRAAFPAVRRVSIILIPTYRTYFFTHRIFSTSMFQVLLDCSLFFIIQ